MGRATKEVVFGLPRFGGRSDYLAFILSNLPLSVNSRPSRVITNRVLMFDRVLAFLSFTIYLLSTFTLSLRKSKMMFSDCLTAFLKLCSKEVSLLLVGLLVS